VVEARAVLQRQVHAYCDDGLGTGPDLEDRRALEVPVADPQMRDFEAAEREQVAGRERQLVLFGSD